MGKGIFVTLEGCEGGGKSTQSRSIKSVLEKKGIAVTLLREPGGTALGDKLRRILKFGNFPLNPSSELLLFNASRVQLVEEKIVPALRRGEVVICDRFTDSTLAYQGYGRGMPLTLIEKINSVATNNLVPDLTILLDIDPEVGMYRNSGKRDRFEQNFDSEEKKSFHKRVREGYLQLAEKDSHRWLIIDGKLDAKDVTTKILHSIETIIAK
ncbi:MAG: dTMP kinase [SAR202 cluster bacterium]|nr:dTMP kinase [SAR202 cluster bacterium]|tara:strand:- start:2323 stop:2955 length:633 start_codon:yes stop_codon:yes gene_type:complete